MQGWIDVYETVNDDGLPIRVMDSEGAYQSATYLGEHRYELAFDYHRAYNHLFEALSPDKILMLGGGGYAYPKHVVRNHPGIRVDVVEIDPLITAIARKHFFIDELIDELGPDADRRLRLITAEAREFLDSCTERYGAVVNDCFRGRSPVMTLASVESAWAIKRCLEPDGIYLTNIISSLEGDESYYLHSIVRTLREEFGHVWVVPCNPDVPVERANNIVIASDGPYTFSETYPLEPSDASRVFHDDLAAMYEDLFWVEDA